MLRNLQVLDLYNRDYKSTITDAVMIRLFKTCLQLHTVSIKKFPKLSKLTFEAVLVDCKELKSFNFMIQNSPYSEWNRDIEREKPLISQITLNHTLTELVAEWDTLQVVLFDQLTHKKTTIRLQIELMDWVSHALSQQPTVGTIQSITIDRCVSFSGIRKFVKKCKNLTKCHINFDWDGNFFSCESELHYVAENVPQVTSVLYRGPAGKLINFVGKCCSV